jgi:hypothetical protein
VVVVMVAIDHRLMAHHVMVMAHDVVMTMMVVMVMADRLRRGHAGRQGEGKGRRERQGHEFQGLPPD